MGKWKEKEGGRKGEERERIDQLSIPFKSIAAMINKAISE